MAVYVRNEILDIFQKPVIDNSVRSCNEHTYSPSGSPNYKHSDTVIFMINNMDLNLNVSESYIDIEGTFTPTEAGKKCYLANNAILGLFDEIRYEMGGQKVAECRKPIITTAMKNMVSFGASQTNSLSSTGWGLTEQNQVLVDSTSHTFSGRIPLKNVFGFAEDYKKGIISVKHELTLLIARSFENCYIGEVGAEMSITKIVWRAKHIIPETDADVMLYRKLNDRDLKTIRIPYRMWDLYELPTLRQTSHDIWAIKTTTTMERPRYVIVGFQNTSFSESRKDDVTKFTSADISNIRLYLNSEVYPLERWNLDFNKKMDTLAYYAYEDFQKSYYKKDCVEPMLSLAEFRENPLFVIDCSIQPRPIKSSTVDVKLEFETRQTRFPKDTKAYALIIHDAYLSYNALDGTVQTEFITL